jgi:hypothetical protein
MKSKKLPVPVPFFMLTYTYTGRYLLWFQEEVFNVKKITYPGSGKISSLIPHPGDKKAQVPGSTTLQLTFCFCCQYGMYRLVGEYRYVATGSTGTVLSVPIRYS